MSLSASAADATKPHEYDVGDLEYLRHDSGPLLARTYVPRGAGPFPAIVEIHGGAWTHFDRTRGRTTHEALARSGVTVVALDFRQGPEGPYPASSNDINYGVRWVKSQAARLKTRPDFVGISGNSSGGHLAALCAMRPDDPRYSQVPLPAGAAPDGAASFDASVRCAVLCWPVINPLGRYRNARRLAARPETAESGQRLIRSHDDYWKTEAAMAEGNPMLMLERGDPVSLPPAIWIQGENDPVHNYRDEDSKFPGREAERFVANYRKAGGRIELQYYDAPMMFLTDHPELPVSVAALERIVRFVHDNIPAKS